MAQDFSTIGHALAAPVRSTILNLLMDGSRRPASELAAAARVTPSTASEHLGVLTDAGLITCTARGRQRFYGLADATVARALEAIGEVCPPAPPVGLRQTREQNRLAQARLCYDHLAGRLGVTLASRMVAEGWLSGESLSLTPAGAGQLSAIGVDVSPAPTGHRPLTRECLDWTERHVHLAGTLGAHLADTFLTRAWVQRHSTGRGLEITEDGFAALQIHWGIDRAALGAGI